MEPITVIVQEQVVQVITPEEPQPIMIQEYAQDVARAESVLAQVQALKLQVEAYANAAQAAADSIFYSAQIKVNADSQTLVTGTNKAYFVVSEELNGYSLVKAHASVSTPSSVGNISINLGSQVHGDGILSTPITIDQNEYTSYTAAVIAVVNNTKSVFSKGDIIDIDVIAAGSGAKGLAVILTFEKI